MKKILYVGMDVHKAMIVIVVLDIAGKLVMETKIETKAQAVLDFVKQLRGTVQVTFEEGTQATWLYDLLRPQVEKVIVCDPRHNHLLKSGNKSDRVDARKLAQLLRAGLLRAVYHGEQGTRTLKELARNYRVLVGDTTRIKNRLKAIYRGRAIECEGLEVYRASTRATWLEKLSERGLRTRAESLYEQLDSQMALRRKACRAMIAESRQHKAKKLLQQITALGAIRVAEIMAVTHNPNRFRTKRQYWSYCGLAVVTSGSAQYEFVEQKATRRKKATQTRGLNRNYNRRLKEVFKAAASAAHAKSPYKEFYEQLLAQGIRPEMARLTLARKLAATVLRIWKNEEEFDATKLMR